MPSADAHDPLNVRLRPAREHDLAAVMRLLSENHMPTAGVPESLHDFVVAEIEDGTRRIVGVVGLEVRRDEALLRSAAVDREWRGHGIGARLVQRIIDDADEKGIHTLYLLTVTAEAYFPHFGFTRASRDVVPPALRETAEFTGACPSTATLMWRQRPAAAAPR